ncbi:hypothetical protein R3P38DRAFT_54297 [Favolaschia claudopus]|uniref:receptor protein-tyrosine kinase n=1 Tax=Favolaschia claudopus TaxID=2862362 RepID=A0AAW0EGY9_9AGAR
MYQVPCETLALSRRLSAEHKHDPTRPFRSAQRAFFMFSSTYLVASIFYAWALIQRVSATHNVTIDDSDLDHWTFVGSYHAVTPTSPCKECLAKPDPGLAFNSTWHDGSLSSGSFQFQGSAVYIFGIDVVNPANVTFVLANPNRNGFHYYGGSGFVYNSLFFSATDLDPTVQHTVTWLMEKSSGGGSAALLDYAVITVEDASSSSVSGGPSSSSSGPTNSESASPSPNTNILPSQKSKSNAGAIAGAVVGVLALLAILGGLFIFWRRKRLVDREAQKDDLSGNYLVEPYQPTVLPPSPPSLQSRPAFHSPPSDSGSVSMSMVAQSTSVSTGPSMDRKGGSAPGWTSRSEDSSSQAAADPAVEERLRHLEQVVNASQPPRYSAHDHGT